MGFTMSDADFGTALQLRIGRTPSMGGGTAVRRFFWDRKRAAVAAELLVCLFVCVQSTTDKKTAEGELCRRCLGWVGNEEPEVKAESEEVEKSEALFLAFF